MTKLDVKTLNAFCRLRDLVYVETGESTSEGEVYRFLDFNNQSMKFNASEINQTVREGYSKG